MILHTDEATHAGYHYSSVLYLNTQGEDFEGGNFIWNDPLSEDAADDCEDGVEECERCRVSNASTCWFCKVPQARVALGGVQCARQARHR